MGRVLAADLRNGVSGEGQRIALVPDHGRRVLPDGVAFFTETVEGEQQQASRRLVVNVKVAVQVDRPREEGPPVLLLDAVFVNCPAGAFRFFRRLWTVQQLRQRPQRIAHQCVVVGQVNMVMHIVRGLQEGLIHWDGRMLFGLHSA